MDIALLSVIALQLRVEAELLLQRLPVLSRKRERSLTKDERVDLAKSAYRHKVRAGKLLVRALQNGALPEFSELLQKKLPRAVKEDGDRLGAEVFESIAQRLIGRREYAAEYRARGLSGLYAHAMRIIAKRIEAR